eukprot:TRINITY_DN3236_c0_g1_i1.p2 TRINITY_DN3236_c0_g1~~TRINITY_DN3236_c0_g1_i1.p2  ORF type:complete len:257 (+),score=61.98 TRINITY_DN3236_c0_g1_i1:68-838(+)
MLSFQEALEEDRQRAAYFADDGENGPPEDDLLDGWDDIDVGFLADMELRPEVRLFAGRPADLRLRCRDGRTIAVHRAVLAEAGCLEALAVEEAEGAKGAASSSSSSVDVPEHSSVLVEVMRWLYCRDATAEKDTLLEVHRLAEQYGIDGLVEHCCRLLVALGVVTVSGAPASGAGAGASAAPSGGSDGGPAPAAAAAESADAAAREDGNVSSDAAATNESIGAPVAAAAAADAGGDAGGAQSRRGAELPPGKQKDV